MGEEAQLVSGIDFISIPSRNLEESISFYGEVLQLPCLVRYSRESGAEFQAGQVTLQVLDSAAHGLDFQATTVPIALRVENVADARALLQGKGVRFFAETLDSGVCRRAVFHDPDGNRLMLHERYRPR